MGFQDCDRRARVCSRAGEPSMTQQTVISTRALPALCVPLLQQRHLHPQNRSLDGIQPAVGANFLVIIALPAAMIAQAAHTLRQLCVIGSQRTRITESTQIVCGIETECGCQPDRTSQLAVPGRAYGS